MTEHNAFFITIRGKRDGFPEEITEKEKIIMNIHFINLKRLKEDKKLVKAGRNLDNDL
ncbi:MAG: hypothetical protein ACXAC8_04300 [Candidatus Hodarchaeales archaeon]